MNKNLLEELQGKISFVYELNNKLYAIGHYKVFDCKYSKVVAPDFTRLFNIYKANIKSTDEELDKDEVAKIMYKLASYSSDEVQTEDNQEYIITIKEFLSKRTTEEKILIKKQVDEFAKMFLKTGMTKLYPSVSYVF